MPIRNVDIAAIFNEIADILEIEQTNPFRVRAYRNASRMLQSFNEEVSDKLERGEDLTKLAGIGESLASKIEEIVETGRCRSLEKLRNGFSPSLTELLDIPGLGPKRVHTLYHELDIHTPEQLFRAARDGRLRHLPHFGEKVETRILESMAFYTQKSTRIKRSTAEQYIATFTDFLKIPKGVKKVTVAGSYRRCKETVGDLDILISAEHSKPVMNHLVTYRDIIEVVAKGETRATVILQGNLQVDVRIVEQSSYGAALHYFTGSKTHNIAIRRRAQTLGLKINEYGVFKNKVKISGKTEASVFESIGLPWIAPELRENRGEIEAAESGKLPILIEPTDLKGDLHVHTNATDGHNSLEQMANAAKLHGWSYLAITEHSKRLTVAHGLNESRLLKQIDEIDDLNQQLQGITLLKGIEVDILENGDLDLSNKVLTKLDLVICAIHSKFHLSRKKQTERILKAMDQPCFTLLAHPSGRLLQKREPFDVDMPRIIRQAKQRGCFLEVNAQPDRLDLSDIYCHMAKDEGVLLSINSDAHSINDFNSIVNGVGQARRGWIEKKDVLNTRTLNQLLKLLKSTRL